MTLLIVSGLFLLIMQSHKNARGNVIKQRLSGISATVKAKPESVEPVLTKIYKRTSKLINAMDFFEEQFILKVAMILFFNSLAFFLHYFGVISLTVKSGMLFFIISVIIVILIPALIKKKVAYQRAKKINMDLPYAIDVIAICIRSGMTIENSFGYISRNFNNINPDIAILFERTLLKTEVSGIIEALEKLYDEVPSPEIRMFCSTLQQSVSFGSSIYPILIELSQDIREMQLLAVEENVASLSAKMSAPMIIFIMFPILAIVAGPGFIRMLSIWSNY
ncbi:type II secretion system F family protein [Salmonella enterica]